MNNPLLTWKELPYPSSEDRNLHTSTLFKNYIITFGGYSNKSKAFLGFTILNLNSGSYEDFILKGDKISQRSKHSACLLDMNKILIFGGFTGDKILNDTVMITIKETIRTLILLLSNLIVLKHLH